MQEEYSGQDRAIVSTDDTIGFKLTPEEQLFRSGVQDMQFDIGRWAARKGWWDGEYNGPEKIALMHSELSEMLEAMRHPEGLQPDTHCPRYSNLAIEAADVMIRLLEFCAHEKIDLAEAVIVKHRYNETRPHKHGGKKF